MRSAKLSYIEFLGGMAVGLGLTAVAFLTVGAVRRAHSRREASMTLSIDAYETSGPGLDVRPTEEGNGSMRRLASEQPDFAPISQRW